MEKDLCEICNEPYTTLKDMGARAIFCSSSFHCCRNCKWQNGKIIEECQDCKDYFNSFNTIIHILS